MKIIFVRHGKDDSNYRGGWSTMDLTEEGKIQAMRLAEFLYSQKGTFDISQYLQMSSGWEQTLETECSLHQITLTRCTRLP